VKLTVHLRIRFSVATVTYYKFEQSWSFKLAAVPGVTSGHTTAFNQRGIMLEFITEQGT
jgi:hypothetical protein